MADGEIEAFLFHEARLLDGQQFEEWLELLTSDVTYFVPNFSDDGLNGAVIKEEAIGLRARVARLGHKQNPTRKPPARTLHTITNVLVLAQDGNAARVTSNLVYYVSKDRRVLDYPARVEHELVRAEGSWKIRAKTIYLLANDLALGQLALI